ncbi:MAG: hypothetical protein N3A61_00675, partial [Ignavibacteria bacterium]|nr:hypothetical protein [Ignavibacteria bacterium]
MIPPRSPGSMTGSQFMNYVMNMTFEQRENEILREISKGNIPDFLRNLKSLKAKWKDNDSIEHNVIYYVMPDYLAIGSDEDYCRIPMGPITAQKIANLFGAVMPTTKLVDDIYFKADLKLAPITYKPVGNQNELIPKFIQHNQEIEAQRIA